MNCYELDECKCHSAICRLSGNYLLARVPVLLDVSGRTSCKYGVKFYPRRLSEVLNLVWRDVSREALLVELRSNNTEESALGTFNNYRGSLSKVIYNVNTEDDGGNTKNESSNNHQKV